MKFEHIDTKIPVLGPQRVPSPIKRGEKGGLTFVNDTDRVVMDVNLSNIIQTVKEGKELISFELAGPREKLYFDPSKLRCGLVTCGGLCPGLNDIIRAIVLELFYGYGVKNIFGFKYGLQGFIPKYMHDIIDLKPETIANIHEMGGSILGSSRGPQSIDEIVDSLERLNIGILFMIGGDGTLMAAAKIAEVVTERDLKISIIGIPKTIDNDIYMVSRSFGFDTAVDVATQAIRSAHNESIGYPNGIGLIKLMGRHSGFIAATATLAQQDVNFVLIPEVDFDLEGPNGFFASLEKRLSQRGHAVVVVAEGAGQKFFKDETAEQDESGNIKLKDIGIFLKHTILSHFHGKGIDISLKYIDPSYMIRSLPANANDNVFCSFLGRDAVHAGMAGKTKLLVGRWNNHFVHIPMSASAGKLWLSVLGATGQGSLKNDH
ncbi:MAG: ATP-dependent 6-phosphofructokinase [Desulfobacterales bacterium]